MRRIAPRQSYPDADTYPPLVDRALPESTPPSRRAFLRGAAVVGAALAGSLVPDPRGPEARAAARGRAPARITLPIRQRYTFRHGNYQLQGAVAQTAHADLAKFLGDAKQAREIERAIRKILDGHSCVDLLDGRRLTRLQERVGTALASLYRRKRGRAAPRPTVVLFVGVPNESCDGDCPPATPVCNPPKP